MVRADTARMPIAAKKKHIVTSRQHAKSYLLATGCQVRTMVVISKDLHMVLGIVVVKSDGNSGRQL